MRLRAPFVVTMSFSVALACSTKDEDDPQPFIANPPPCSLTGGKPPCDDGSRRRSPPDAEAAEAGMEAGPIVCDFPTCPVDSPIPGTDCGVCPTPIGIECMYGKTVCPTRATCEPSGKWQVGASICDASGDSFVDH